MAGGCFQQPCGESPAEPHAHQCREEGCVIPAPSPSSHPLPSCKLLPAHTHRGERLTRFLWLPKHLSSTSLHVSSGLHVLGPLVLSIWGHLDYSRVCVFLHCQQEGESPRTWGQGFSSCRQSRSACWVGEVSGASPELPSPSCSALTVGGRGSGAPGLALRALRAFHRFLSCLP